MKSHKVSLCYILYGAKCFKDDEHVLPHVLIAVVSSIPQYLQVVWHCFPHFASPVEDTIICFCIVMNHCYEN